MSPPGGNVIVIQVWDNAGAKGEWINHLKFHCVIGIALETSFRFVEGHVRQRQFH